MFCVNCGTELNDNAKFCSNCGYKVGNAIEPKGDYIPKKVVPFVIRGKEVDTIEIEKYAKNYGDLIKRISRVVGLSQKEVNLEYVKQRFDIVTSKLRIYDVLDETGNVLNGINVLEKLQNARLGAKEIPNIVKEVMSRLNCEYVSKLDITYYIEKLANKHKIKGTYEGPMMCPRCGSTDLSSARKGFSGGKAVAGGLLLGPVGIVAGGLGSNKVKIHCMNCGYNAGPLGFPKV